MVEVIEVDLVAFEMCYFKFLDILQRLMCIFWAMSIVHDMNSEKSVDCFFGCKSPNVSVLLAWKKSALFSSNSLKLESASIAWY